ncbi:hypothetical protein DN406_24235 [Bacillus sp. BB56-3]|nr:hypothetical protein DN406_24235 [Bacillus sp. BB56-3]
MKSTINPDLITFFINCSLVTRTTWEKRFLFPVFLRARLGKKIEFIYVSKNKDTIQSLIKKDFQRNYKKNARMTWEKCFLFLFYEEKRILKLVYLVAGVSSFFVIRTTWEKCFL